MRNHADSWDLFCSGSLSPLDGRRVSDQSSAASLVSRQPAAVGRGDWSFHLSLRGGLLGHFFLMFSAFNSFSIFFPGFSRAFTKFKGAHASLSLLYSRREGRGYSPRSGD